MVLCVIHNRWSAFVLQHIVCIARPDLQFAYLNTIRRNNHSLFTTAVREVIHIGSVKTVIHENRHEFPAECNITDTTDTTLRIRIRIRHGQASYCATGRHEGQRRCGIIAKQILQASFTRCNGVFTLNIDGEVCQTDFQRSRNGSTIQRQRCRRIICCRCKHHLAVAQHVIGIQPIHARVTNI